MIRPHPRRFIPGRAARVVWKAEFMLIATIRSQRSGAKVSTGSTVWIPALLTNTSTTPKMSSAALIIETISSGFDMSAG